jgi:hypothetical protein
MRGREWLLPALVLCICFCGLALFALPLAENHGYSAAAADDTVAGGLLQLPPTQSLGRNQVSNSTFESGEEDWKLPPCWSIDGSIAHEGRKSLRFEAGGGCQPQPAQISINRSANAGRSYTLRAWVRTSEGSDLRVRIGLHDSRDQSFVVGETDFATPGPAWQQVVKKDIDLLPIHDGHTLEVRAVVQGTVGTAWFDDVELVEEDPLPLSVFLLYPNFHGYLWGDGPQKIRFRVDVGLPSASSSIRASLKAEHGEAVKSLAQEARASQELEFDGSTLARGPYLLAVELVDRRSGVIQASYPAYRITKVSGEFRNHLVNYIGPDNYLVHAGKTRFVWGVYDRFSARFRCRDCVFTNEKGYLGIPGLDGRTTLDNYAESKLNAEMNILPFAGINVERLRDQLSPWLEALESKGVGHLQIVNNWMEDSRGRPLWAKGMSDPELWDLLTSTMKGKRGGLGYYTYDEPRLDQIQAVFEQYKALREHDPGSVDYGVLVNASKVFRWRDMSDVLGCDPYPVNGFVNADAVAYGATAPPAMLLTSAWTQAAVNQVYGSRPIWMVLQLFRMGRFFPNYEQMKIQAYDAIINGATGILWWGFVSEKGLEAEWYREDDHQAYFDFRRLSQEVMALEPALVAPARTDLLASVSNSHIETLVKLQGNRAVIFASNFLPEAAGSVEFSLASSIGRTIASTNVEVYSENRKLSLDNIKNAPAFSDSFGPYEVHVYILETDASSQESLAPGMKSKKPASP